MVISKLTQVWLWSEHNERACRRRLDLSSLCHCQEGRGPSPSSSWSSSSQFVYNRSLSSLVVTIQRCRCQLPVDPPLKLSSMAARWALSKNQSSWENSLLWRFALGAWWVGHEGGEWTWSCSQSSLSGDLQIPLYSEQIPILYTLSKISYTLSRFLYTLSNFLSTLSKIYFNLVLFLELYRLKKNIQNFFLPG